MKPNKIKLFTFYSLLLGFFAFRFGLAGSGLLFRGFLFLVSHNKST